MSERGRRLELCKEWGEGTDGSDFDSWLMDKVIVLETELRRHRQGLMNLMEMRKIAGTDRYGALTREEIETSIAEIDEALKPGDKW